jgi:hypothetical protein
MRTHHRDPYSFLSLGEYLNALTLDEYIGPHTPEQVVGLARGTGEKA